MVVRVPSGQLTALTWLDGFANPSPTYVKNNERVKMPTKNQMPTHFQLIFGIFIYVVGE